MCFNMCNHESEEIGIRSKKQEVDIMWACTEANGRNGRFESPQPLSGTKRVLDAVEICWGSSIGCPVESDRRVQRDANPF